MKALIMGSKPKKNEDPAFTNFTFKVHSKSSWQDTVDTVLKSVQGVSTFRMDKDRNINISGYIDPPQLLKNLKKAGKKAEMVYWQYGECSNNLFEKTEPPPANDNQNGASAGGDCFLYPRWPNGYGYRYGSEYGYNNGYPRIERNYAYNHLECSGNAQDCNGHHMQQSMNIGNAQDCNGHHMEQPNNSAEKSYLSTPKNITGSRKNPIRSTKNVSKYCSLM